MATKPRTPTKAKRGRASATHNAGRSAAGSRVDIIRATTPLGFFVLVVLVVEAIIGVVAGFSNAADRTMIVLIMSAIGVLLVATVAALAVFMPGALNLQLAASSLPALDVQAPELPVIEKPAILLAGTSMFTETTDMGFHHDIEAVRLLEDPPKRIETGLGSERLRQVLLREKYDIIHLLVQVDQVSGDLQFSNNDKLATDDLVQLVRMTGAKLIILATCDSIALGGQLSRVANVIAASSSIGVSAIASWEQSFFTILSQGYPLSHAFEVSRRMDGVPLVLLMKADLAFSMN